MAATGAKRTRVKPNCPFQYRPTQALKYEGWIAALSQVTTEAPPTTSRLGRLVAIWRTEE